MVSRFLCGCGRNGTELKKWNIKFKDLEFKSLEKEGGKNYYEIGDKVKVAILPQNIFRYDETGML